MAIHEAVAEEVRVILARRQLKQQAVADALGWSPWYLSRRLKGETPFDVNDLAALAELLNVDVRAFFEVPERSAGGGLNKLSKCSPSHADLPQPARPAPCPPLAAVA